MNVMPNVNQDTATLTQPRARVGLIIPSVNTYSEPQFNHFAPDGLAINNQLQVTWICRSGLRLVVGHDGSQSQHGRLCRTKATCLAVLGQKLQ